MNPHVGILVRVQWPMDDDPQNRALTWLGEVVRAGIRATGGFAEVSEVDSAHGVISVDVKG